MSNLLIKNAIHNKMLKDILIKDGKIIKIDKNIDSKFSVIDAENNLIFPGFIDIHTHLADIYSDIFVQDDYKSASEISLINGITSFFTFITENTKFSLNDQIKRHQKISELSSCDYHWHLTPINFDKSSLNNIENLIYRGFKSYKVFTTYKKANIYSSYSKISEFAKFLKEYDACLFVHCEDEHILDTFRNSTFDSTKLINHAITRPKEAEIEAVKRILEICSKYLIKTHIVHVSCQESAELIYNAKKFLPVTNETCPQYLYLDDSYLDFCYFICSPPLRSKETVSHMKEMAINNYFDCFATDHCRFSLKDKIKYKNDFRFIPNGISGLGALVPLIFNLFHSNPENLAYYLSEMPAKICNCYPNKGSISVGADADLVILNSKENRKITTAVNNDYEPYHDFESKLNIIYTIKSGEVVVKDNQIIKSISGKEINRVKKS